MQRAQRRDGSSARRLRRGQSTAEFALMIPLILALLFAVIEYAYYLGALNYVNYATFSAARGFSVSDDPTAIASDLLTGNMVDYGDGDVTVDVDASTGTVTSTLLWEATSPGFRQLMGEMDASMSVTMGEPECVHEGVGKLGMVAASGNTAVNRSDNRMLCR